MCVYMHMYAHGRVGVLGSQTPGSASIKHDTQLMELIMPLTVHHLEDNWCQSLHPNVKNSLRQINEKDITTYN